MTNDFPLVLSMTGFQNYRRCRKLFEYSDIRQLSPKVESEPVELGSQGHELLAYAATHEGQLPSDWGGDTLMYQVAQEYLGRKRVNFGDVLAVERGFFAEIAPNVFIRGTFDVAYREGNFVVVQDYKTFAKAPTLDPDRDNQGKEYTLIASMAFGLPVRDIVFRWEYIRRELGRMLKGKKKDEQNYVEWTDDERYFRQDMIISLVEEETLRKELYDCALDIKDTIEKQRFYRTPLRGVSPFTCGSCFFRDICSAELNAGTLSDADLELFTQPFDPSERVSVQTMTQDPRVKWYQGRDLPMRAAIAEVYGANGVARYDEGLFALAALGATS